MKWIRSKDKIVTEKGEGNNDRLWMAHTAFPRLFRFLLLTYIREEN